jgi:hypothetical protein
VIRDGDRRVIVAPPTGYASLPWLRRRMALRIRPYAIRHGPASRVDGEVALEPKESFADQPSAFTASNTRCAIASWRC